MNSTRVFGNFLRAPLHRIDVDIENNTFLILHKSCLLFMRQTEKIRVGFHGVRSESLLLSDCDGCLRLTGACAVHECGQNLSELA